MNIRGICGGGSPGTEMLGYQMDNGAWGDENSMSQEVNQLQRKDFGGRKEIRRCTRQYVEKSPGDHGYLGKQVGLLEGLEINRKKT